MDANERTLQARLGWIALALAIGCLAVGVMAGCTAGPPGAQGPAGMDAPLSEVETLRQQVAALENLDQWLIQAGGEAFRQKIIQLAAQGKEAWEQSQQEVRIVA